MAGQPGAEGVDGGKPSPAAGDAAATAEPLDLAPSSAERLREAYERVHPRLWRSVLGWSGSREVADEAIAEAFAQAARRVDELRDVDAWVWRSAFRIAAGELHRRARRDLPAGSASEVLTDQHAYAAEGGGDGDLPETVLDLVDALASLSAQQRACVVLRDIADLSAAEVAETIGTTATTVRVQALRGRRKLREYLESNDG